MNAANCSFLLAALLTCAAGEFAVYAKSAKTAPPPATPKWLCDGVENAWPNAALACSDTDRKNPDVAQRLEGFARAKQQCLELLEFSNSERRARIDASQARACVAAREAQVRGGPAIAVTAACSRAIIGLRKLGESCDAAWECAAGTACIGPDGAAPGKCAKPLALGANCGLETGNGSVLYALVAATRSPCGEGRHCQAKPTGAVCAADEAAIAQSLGGTENGKACNSTATCPTHQRCLNAYCVDICKRR